MGFGFHKHGVTVFDLSFELRDAIGHPVTTLRRISGNRVVHCVRSHVSTEIHGRIAIGTATNGLKVSMNCRLLTAGFADSSRKGKTYNGCIFGSGRCTAPHCEDS